MTDEERKALVEQCRYDAVAYPESISAEDSGDMFSLAYQWQDKPHRHVYTLCRKLAHAADQIEADGQRIAELEAALREVFEEWAGSEGFIPETAPEGYLLQLVKKMALITREALRGDA